MNIKSPKIAILSLVGSITLSACSGNLNALNLPDTLNKINSGSTGSSPSTSTVSNSGLLASARSKRVIPITGASGASATGGTSVSTNVSVRVPMAAPSAAATAAPAMAEKVSADIAAPAPMAVPARMGLMMPYYGGGDFNNYVVTFAEENIYPGAKVSTLLQAYSQVIQPILKEWDPKARLLESRGNLVRASGNDDSNVEYVYLPGADPSKNIKIRPDWVFRLASTPLKETLQIYVMGDETRVHRMIYGEPHVDVSKVKLDSDKAMELARQAFANREKTSYPSYPEMQYLDPRSQIIYEIPSQVNWRIQLNQQETKLRYFLSFDYKEGQEPTVKPDSTTASSGCYSNGICWASAASPVMVDAATPSSPVPSTVPVEPRCAAPPPPPVQYFSGSITIDAVTGAVEQLNRPVRYSYTYDTPCYPKPMPVPMPMPVPEVSASSGAGSIGMAVPGSTGVEMVVSATPSSFSSPSPQPTASPSP